MLSYPPDVAGGLLFLLLLLSWWSGGGLAAAGGIPALLSVVGALSLDFDWVGVLSFFEPPTAARIESGGSFFDGGGGWDAMVDGYRDGMVQLLLLLQ